MSLTLVVALTMGACRFLLPERFAINAPIAHMMFGARGVDAPPASSFGSRIRVPDGFSIGLYASDIPNARFLRPTPSGGLLVSVPRSGKVVLLAPDADRDGRADAAVDLLTELDRPHGLDLHGGWLYVAEGDAIGRIRFDGERNAAQGEYERIVEGLPNGGNHWSKTVRMGPDGWLYVSVGSSCNICEDPPRRAAMLRFRPDGSGEELFASGLRNSVGFDWRPGTHELYATDNGRDLLGDDLPPCELNRIVQGSFYGWPYAHGDRIVDPDFGERRPDLVAASTPPAHSFRAHNAPLGMTFLRHEAVPADYVGAALVALHGSWNRTRKDGYKVVSLHWRDDGSIEERDFAFGFEQDGDVIGRPVDVAEGPDGVIYVSDDYAGSIYRVAYGAARATAATSATPATPVISAIPSTTGMLAMSSAERTERTVRGAALYERFECASCHETARAMPGVVPVLLVDLATRYDAPKLSALLVTPTPAMPVYPMSAEERLDLAAFLLDR